MASILAAPTAPAVLPPLVEPADGLTPAEVERYSRHLIIPEIGAVGQRRLKNAKVLVIGAGGLGSPALLYLAAAGVGTLGIVDDDAVDLSNLQRQVIHGVHDVGTPKIESARKAIAELNPLVTVVLHNQRLDASNALELFAGYDLILDGADNFATRYLVNDAAAILGKPYVWGSIFRFDGQVSVFWAEHGPTYRDLYPEAPPAGSVPSCGEGGVFGMLCAAVGSLMVTEAVKLITGVGRSLLGRVALFDALGGSWREIKVSKDPEAQPITELTDYEAFCGVTPPAPTDGEHTVTAKELAAMLAERAAGERDFDLVDVRESGEYSIVNIDGAVLIPQGRILAGEAWVDLPQNRDIVFHCKAGTRSAAVLEAARKAGYTRVSHLDGGILAWVRDVEPEKPVY
ncbi:MULTISPECIES: molybdopterin-synthase adenylyltransferase MoeB [Paenarthrobacter]|jgi:adenylyltransferase/sulfurtransferase|uniref:molybdopterin-synthase adenylyltransferase MoeB n=1 Tax=Paenarthrobacter TaxID=1742992 RepID=UPI001877AA20|nr:MULTISPECIES: molybdopterin-synthase adenylyltransferase MoeB [Paenarthrobacter]QOT16379.1 molybdopterin-synthase adenylyltransferase MoeB [Paenarthrobacter sp. YJN-5]QQQ61337.1 molybdopterin-synthase adenylyltransferase MoeB [Paenarthrobacter ureafaciens]UOD80074.1 molybdopterin-synthase adenylyltransferase MoeB [Paenarthrobacter ureafaciens]WNZ04583.1 molybdopterin-synthase adenylyltransferase MoeB [Paenarthrobacter ureafaciens]